LDANAQASLIGSWLADFYVDRTEGQWQSVSNCVDDLSKGSVVAPKHIAWIALGQEPKEDVQKDVFARLQKINGRVGAPGRREAHRMCLTAVQWATEAPTVERNELILAFTRMGFGISRDAQLEHVYTAAIKVVRDQILKGPKAPKAISADPTALAEEANRNRDFQTVEQQRLDVLLTELAREPRRPLGLAYAAIRGRDRLPSQAELDLLRANLADKVSDAIDVGHVPALAAVVAGNDYPLLSSTKQVRSEKVHWSEMLVFQLALEVHHAKVHK
jgi:hypothetical protein